jgi:hypothetical protein
MSLDILAIFISSVCLFLSYLFVDARPGAVVLPHGAIAERHFVHPRPACVCAILKNVPRLMGLVFEWVLVRRRPFGWAVVFQHLKEVVFFSDADVVRTKPYATCGLVAGVHPLNVGLYSVRPFPREKLNDGNRACLRCKGRAGKQQQKNHQFHLFLSSSFCSQLSAARVYLKLYCALVMHTVQSETAFETHHRYNHPNAYYKANSLGRRLTAIVFVTAGAFSWRCAGSGTNRTLGLQRRQTIQRG